MSNLREDLGKLVKLPFKAVGAAAGAVSGVANKTVMPIISGVATEAVAKPYVNHVMSKAAPGGKTYMETSLGKLDIENIKVKPRLEFKLDKLRPTMKQHIDISADSTIDLRKKLNKSGAVGPAAGAEAGLPIFDSNAEGFSPFRHTGVASGVAGGAAGAGAGLLSNLIASKLFGYDDDWRTYLGSGIAGAAGGAGAGYYGGQQLQDKLNFYNENPKKLIEGLEKLENSEGLKRFSEWQRGSKAMLPLRRALGRVITNIKEPVGYGLGGKESKDSLIGRAKKLGPGGLAGLFFGTSPDRPAYRMSPNQSDTVVAREALFRDYFDLPSRLSGDTSGIGVHSSDFWTPDLDEEGNPTKNWRFNKEHSKGIDLARQVEDAVWDVDYPEPNIPDAGWQDFTATVQEMRRKQFEAEDDGDQETADAIKAKLDNLVSEFVNPKKEAPKSFGAQHGTLGGFSVKGERGNRSISDPWDFSTGKARDVMEYGATNAMDVEKGTYKGEGRDGNAKDTIWDLTDKEKDHHKNKSILMHHLRNIVDSAIGNPVTVKQKVGPRTYELPTRDQLGLQPDYYNDDESYN